MGRRVRWWSTLGIGVLLTACGGGGTDGGKVNCSPAAQPTATGVAPSDLMDLSHWSLTLPVDTNGNHSGTARVVTTSELLSGYSSDWFYGTGNDGVTFFAPVQGATTKSTPYPRSELRELLDPNNYAANWSSADTAELLADLVVHQVPSANGKVTIGEIVGYNGENPDVTVLTKLVYEFNPGQCTAVLYTSTLDTPSTLGSQARRQNLTTVPLGTPFSYSIRVENKQIRFTSGMASVTETIGSAWDAEGLYFRAGAALFTNGTSVTDGARVTFFDLRALHE
jgi:hypothetical protein